MDRIKVVLDTDTANECDDQFALAYLLLNQDAFEVQAISIAPFSHANENIVDGLDKSRAEIMKICGWLNFPTSGKVYTGAQQYMNDSDSMNPASQRIVELALQNDKTYILAIGAPTNVAIALKQHPEIIDRVSIVWLGSNGLLQSSNDDFNFRQDVSAVRTMFESGVDLTVIPCKNVAATLMTSIYELRHYLQRKSELCDYLLARFYNDTYHGIRERRVIWDIAAVAYLLNPDWSSTVEISCPEIREDTSFALTEGQHSVKFVNYLDVNQIYADLFAKLKKAT